MHVYIRLGVCLCVHILSMFACTYIRMHLSIRVSHMLLVYAASFSSHVLFVYGFSLLV